MSTATAIEPGSSRNAARDLGGKQLRENPHSALDVGQGPVKRFQKCGIINSNSYDLALVRIPLASLIAILSEAAILYWLFGVLIIWENPVQRNNVTDKPHDKRVQHRHREGQHVEQRCRGLRA
jgi:hypothetical protein